ncbi:Sulfite exporter TauE/SafE [Labrenzia sp. THAF82]|uniref:sulfite exporter TauE/SafE family protein n=1 Tax=Labrenzia sp. THAF82 TaxID=2587861 RepID=UPI001268999E|nr:sulfite exporter TauE/SafE family protein [Labrenzia sp. THAF82]QFT31466.1 Sulfite exporter TauE/SafE [Labrenzia sp. THAF82]
MTFEAYLLAALAVFLTGISKSGFAGGLGILGVPLVALTMPPQSAATLLLPVLLLIDIVSVWRFRASWKARTIMALLPGAGIGIGLGMIGFSSLDPNLLKIGIGLLALWFVVRQVFGDKTVAGKHGRLGAVKIFIASLVSGFAGFVAHAGGPPIKGTFLSLGLGKSAFVGTNAMFFFILNLAKAGGYASLGLFSVSGLLSSAALVPFTLMGIWAGFALHDRVPQRLFVRVAFGLLALAGLNLLVFGGAGLLTGAV